MPYHLGLTIGYFVAANNITVIKATVGAIPGVLRGSKFNKAFYIDALAMLFEVLAKVRKEGLMSIEGDIENPEASPIFSKYPNLVSDHHIMEFVTDYLRMMVGGNLNTVEIESLMDVELETHHHEAAEPGHVVASVAGAVPAFGIVVAVMGVSVNVMGSVGSPAGRSRQDDRRRAGGYFPGYSDCLWICRTCCQAAGTKGG